MAEAIFNAEGKGRWQALSAGAKPSGFVHPLAIRILKESGYSTESLRSKSLEEFRGQEFDAVITVCDRAKAVCPVYPGSVMLHWSLEDPAEASGSDEQKLMVFCKIFTDLQTRIRHFIQNGALHDPC